MSSAELGRDVAVERAEEPALEPAGGRAQSYGRLERRRRRRRRGECGQL